MDVKFAIIYSSLCLMLVAGCAQDEPTPDEKTPPAKTAEIQADPADQLVGIWYGQAQLNQQLLQQKLSLSPTPGDRAQLESIARVFQTTEIGAQFDADGKMTLDVQIQPAGQILRDSTEGTWRIVEQQANAVIVETTEPLPAGGTETNQVRYQFEQDGQLAIMVAPTSEQLADCQPVFVFKRVETSNTAVADRAVDSSLK